MLMRLPSRRRVAVMRSGVVGSSLLEVLIAMLVVSVGVLGVSALQTSAIRSQYLSNQIYIANLHAQSMLNMIRANPNFASVYSLDDENLRSPATASKTCVNVAADGCSWGELVTAEMVVWQNQVIEHFGPTATVNVQADDLDYYTSSVPAAHVSISWDSPFGPQKVLLSTVY